MATELILILILIFFLSIGVGYLLFLNLKNQGPSSQEQQTKIILDWMKDMKGSVEKTSESMERKLREQNEAVNNQTKVLWERLDNASKVIGGVQRQLGSIEEFGKDMKDLSNVLKSPKLRGGLGEQFLYDILEDSLPKEFFSIQYRFKNGATCDAVILSSNGIIPIDSKFPMENYKAMIDSENEKDREGFRKVFTKDVEKRIDEISSKYILPDEGTTDQAIMYVPSESIYYELITNNQKIIDYSNKRKVVLSSPNTITFLLRTILLAYKQTELNKSATQIMKSLEGLLVEGEKFNQELEVLEGHVVRTSKSMETVKSRYVKLQGKMEKMHQIETEVDNTNLLTEK
jgi:DNA recombination protein RmuC